MKNNKKILFLYIIFFMQGIVTNIHHPLTPYYVEFLNLKNYMVGLFFAFMNLGIMIGGPFWGNLGDKGKQRSVIFIGLLMYALGQTLFGFGHIFNPLVLSFFRLFSGFGIAAATTVIMSEIILLSDKSVRSRNIAYAVAILALGGAIGYYIGGQIHTNLFFIDLLKTDKFHNALLLQGISISIVATIFYLFYRSENIKTNENKQRSYFWEGFKEIKYIKKSLLFFLISLTLITISQTNVDKYLELYFKDLGYKANTLGNFKMIVGLITIVATFTIVPLIMRVKKRLLLSTILQALSAAVIFIVFKFSPEHFITLVYSLFMIYILIKAVYAPLEQDHISTYANEENTGMMMGIRQSFFLIGTIIGPVFGGFLYDVNPKLLFNISASLFLISIIFIYISNIYTNKESL